MERNEVRETILDAMEESLAAQLRAVRRLRGGEAEAPPRRSRSHMDIVYDILRAARQPLHVEEIIRRTQAAEDVALDRESLVSALTKKVARGQRFARPAPNTFAVLGAGRGKEEGR